MFKKPLPPFRKFKSKIHLKNSKVSEFIYQLGESDILRQESKDVPIDQIKSKETQKKFKYLKDCFLKYKKLTGYGRGIAAVQVGILEKFAYIDTGKELMLIINPKILKTAGERLKYPEGCMSLSPLIVPVIRPAWIEFEYFDQNGNKKIWTKKDNTKLNRGLNRVFQHEIDHLLGILCIDKATDIKDLFLWSDPKFYQSNRYEKI